MKVQLEFLVCVALVFVLVSYAYPITNLVLKPVGLDTCDSECPLELNKNLLNPAKPSLVGVLLHALVAAFLVFLCLKLTGGAVDLGTSSM